MGDATDRRPGSRGGRRNVWSHSSRTTRLRAAHSICADPLTQRSGYLELSQGADAVDRTRQFVAFARGDSMDGGDDPIRHGDPLLFEWVRGMSRADLVGERVLIEQQQGSGHDDRAQAPGPRDDELRVALRQSGVPRRSRATLRCASSPGSRRLDQADVNAFASRIGIRLNGEVSRSSMAQISARRSNSRATHRSAVTRSCSSLSTRPTWTSGRTTSTPLSPRRCSRGARIRHIARQQVGP